MRGLRRSAVAATVSMLVVACSNPAASSAVRSFVGTAQAAVAAISAQGYICTPPGTAPSRPSLPPAVESSFPDITVCSTKVAAWDQIVVIGRGDGSIAGLEISTLDLGSWWISLAPLVTTALVPVLRADDARAVNATISGGISGTSGYVAAGPPGIRVSIRRSSPSAAVIDVAEDDLVAAATR